MSRLIAIAFLLLLAIPAYAEIRATVPGGVAAGGAWQLVAIEWSGSGGAANSVEVNVGDARGGPTYGRVVPYSGGVMRTWVAVPLVDRAELKGDWPLVVTIRTGDTVLESQAVSVDMSPGVALWRVGVPRSMLDAAQRIAWHGYSSNPTMFTALPDEEFFTGPAALFAAFDAVVLPGGGTGEVSQERVFALAGSGARVVVLAENRPLMPLNWQRLESPPSTMSAAGAAQWQRAPVAWVWPAEVLAVPAVVEEDLARTGMLEPARPSGAVLATVILAGPVAIVLVILVRQLFVRRWVVLVAMAAGLAGLTAGACGLLYARAETVTRAATWVVAERASRVEVRETLTTVSPFFEQECPVEGEGMMWPVAEDAGAYWRMRVTVVAEGDTMRVRGLVEARKVISVLARKAEPMISRTPVSASGPATAPAGRRLVGGYVQEKGERVVFTDWLKGRPGAEAMRAWYALRFDGRRAYEFWERAEFVVMEMPVVVPK